MVPDWNFYKYLVDENGYVIKAWGTTSTIEDIYDDIEKAITNLKKGQLKDLNAKKETSNDASGKDEL